MLTTTPSSKTLVNIYMVTKTLIIAKNVTNIAILIPILSCFEIGGVPKLWSDHKMLVGKDEML